MDAMLRHLGAAYYESLHGRATGADLERALDTVEEGLNETGAGGLRSAAHSDRPHRAGREADGGRHPHGWSRRVSDVMTTTMVTVDRITPYKEVARVMAEHRISGLPVLKMGREVVGVVTQADLLREQVRAARRLRSSARRSWRPGGSRHPALTAGELMTSPAVTIGPDATVSAAARLMTEHQVGRLPVTDEDGKLVGIVSRRDLISVFLRADADIAADIRRVLRDILLARPGEADVSVCNGIVTLTGTLDPKAGPHGDLIPVAVRLMWNVDGVVDVVDRLGDAQAAPPALAVPPDAIPSQGVHIPQNRPADAG
jgi:CBS-domain-containing membrane protein